ncbi:replication factor C small subunit [Candidatus Woesearchaeota archaeon]|nr:replication factor C small subunit [Candidatus Woesearchaeota archaeon]
MGAVWAEKYRPSDFSELKGQEETVKRVKAFIEQRNIPHLMFSGHAGTGKTSLAILMAKKLFGPEWRQNFLELNASDERGIDVVRVKVKDFARTRAISNAPFKIICLDESDSLTKEAQQALRRTMENYTATCRFILINNYSSKIIEPIQSRCAIFRFRPLEEGELGAIVDRIAQNEGLSISGNAKKALIEASEGDCRKLANIMQSCAASSRTITEELIYSAASMAKPKEIKEILVLSMGKGFIEARDKLLNAMLSQGLSGLDVVKQIQKELPGLDIGTAKKMRLIDKCGEIEFRMVEGSDEFVQLEALLSNFAMAED